MNYSWVRMFTSDLTHGWWREERIGINGGLPTMTGTKTFRYFEHGLLYQHKVSLHMGDKIMTIDHNGITTIPLISNDTGYARVAQTTKIPACSVKNVRIRVSNTRANSCALLQPINLLKRYNVLLPHCLINNLIPNISCLLWTWKLYLSKCFEQCHVCFV